MILQHMENLPEWATWAAFDRDGGFWVFDGEPFIPHEEIGYWSVLHSAKMELVFQWGCQVPDWPYSRVRLQLPDA